jgi:hypothetical protein
MLDRLGKQSHNVGMKKPKRPKDANQLAKMIAGIATGEVKDSNPLQGKEYASKGGKKGGNARAKALTPLQRREIAQLAAQARWKKS